MQRAGYGVARVDHVAWPVHRLSWVMSHGVIPNGLWVLHRCDNPPCVRPSHLFLGTQSDNMRDMARKGRNPVQRTAAHTARMRAAIRDENRPRGSANARARLTDAGVREIRRLRSTGLSQQAIGERIGVSQSAVSHVLRGKTWGHIDR